MFKGTSIYELQPYLGLQRSQLILGSHEVPKDRDGASKGEGKEETEA